MVIINICQAVLCGLPVYSLHQDRNFSWGHLMMYDNADFVMQNDDEAIGRLNRPAAGGHDLVAAGCAAPPLCWPAPLLPS